MEGFSPPGRKKTTDTWAIINDLGLSDEEIMILDGILADADMEE